MRPYRSDHFSSFVFSLDDKCNVGLYASHCLVQKNSQRSRISDKLLLTFYLTGRLIQDTGGQAVIRTQIKFLVNYKFSEFNYELISNFVRRNH